MGGGVAHFYDALAPHLGSRVSYLEVGTRRHDEGVLLRQWRLACDLVRVARLCADPDVAIVHVNPSLDAKSLLRDAMSLLVARSFGKPTIVFFRGWSDTTARVVEERFLWLFRRIFLRCTAVCVLSEAIGGRVRAWGFSGALRVWTTVVGDDLIRYADTHPRHVWREGEAKPLMLAFMARVVRKKGIFETIEAVALARRRGCPIGLVVAGDGPDMLAARRMVDALGLDGVTFTGQLQGAEKAAALDRADIYVLATSDDEGMPNALLEAMAMGMPAIVTPVAGIADIARRAELGVLLARADADCIATAVVSLASDRERRERIGRANAELAARAFTAREAAARLDLLYDEVIARRESLQPFAAWYAAWPAKETAEALLLD
jgi:glycosyltransferase involved in cell wall biosynthesis